MIKELLKELSFSRIENKIILFLLDYDAVTGASLAKKIEENRSSVYTTLRKLEQRGLVIKLKKQGSSIFKLIENNKLIEILKFELEKYYRLQQQKIKTLSETLVMQGKKKTHHFGAYEISYTSSLPATLLRLEESVSNDYLSVSDPNTALSKEFEKVLFNVQKKKVQFNNNKDILNDGNKAREWIEINKNNSGHQIKLIKTESFYSDFILSNGTVYMFNYDREEPICLSIKHKNYYDFFCKIFQFLWEKLD